MTIHLHRVQPRAQKHRRREKDSKPSRSVLNLREQRAEKHAPDYVLTFRQWCRLNTISEYTGKYLLRQGQGPKVIQLSERRIGIRASDNLAWQESRVRGTE
jgi:hypothetical protein